MYMIRVLEGEDVNTPKHVDEQFICRNVFLRLRVYVFGCDGCLMTVACFSEIFRIFTRIHRNLCV